MTYRLYRYSVLTIGTGEKASLYECRCREVVFQDFSDKLSHHALELGFAPAVPLWAGPEKE